MKVLQTPRLKPNNQNKTMNANTKTSEKIAFTGVGEAVTQGLRFLDTNQGWGANMVDVGFMVLPRTAVDFTRSPEAGLETGRREASGTANHSAVGAYGLGAAFLLAQPFNRKFGVKIHNTFASNEIVDILGHNWNEQLKKYGNSEKALEEFLKKGGNKEEILEGFLQKTFEAVEGFNPSHKDQVDGWVKLPPKTRTDAVKKFKEVIAEAVKAEETNGSKQVKLGKDVQVYLKTLIGSSIETESKFKIASGSAKEVLSIDTFIDNVYKLSKSFMKPKVATEFVTNNKNFVNNAFINGLKHLNIRTSLLGLGIAAAIGCSIQPLNMYLTKKKTGKSGFVGGGEDRQPDHSKKFKILKGLTAGTFGAIVMSTIIKLGEVDKKPMILFKAVRKDLLKKIQFQGFTPTLNQLKFVYGGTIMSRMIVARDKDELRESATKDTLGFLNFLVLGSVVKNFAAAAFEKFVKLDDKEFFRYHENEQGKGWFKKITKSALISRDEVLYKALNEAKIPTVEIDAKGVVKALKFKEMMGALSKHSPNHQALKKIKYLNVAQLIGYLYSGLVLGVGIPKLNIAATKYFDKKRQEQKKDLCFSPANVLFLNDKTRKEKAFVNFAG